MSGKYPVEERFIPTTRDLMNAWVKINHPLNVPEKIEYEEGFFTWLYERRVVING